MNKKIPKIFITIFAVIIAAYYFLFGSDNISFQNQNNIITEDYVGYCFKDEGSLKEHFNKHGKEMGYYTEKEYENGGAAVINNSNALHKYEKEDNDEVYYLLETNEIVFLSSDGYIRTYFCPEDGKAYFDRQ